MGNRPSRSRHARRSLPVLLAALMVAASIPLAAAPAFAADSDVVTMTADLATCVNVNLNQAQGTPITKGMLATLTALSCSADFGHDVDSLSGLQYATDLSALDIEGESTSNGDLTPLSGLSKLNSLQFGAFGVTDLAPVAKLTGLTRLYSFGNPLTDVREVSSLVNLEYLTLESGYIVTPPDLSKLTQLILVNFDDNDLTTPPDLTNLPSLASISLQDNALAALPDLTGSPSVVQVFAEYNRISSLAPVANESLLRTLWVEHDAVIDLTPLALLPDLDSLLVSGERYALPDTLTTVPYSLPSRKDPQGTPIAVTVSPDSSVTGSVSGTTVTWTGVGQGQLDFSQTVVFGSDNDSTTFSGSLLQNAQLGTLTKATPTITGTTTVGQKVTANPGWWGPAPVLLKYQWYRNGTAISGATSSYHTLATADGGTKITVTVTGSKAGYAPVSVSSAPTATVAKLLTAAPTPTVSGTTTVGSTLTATAGTWSPSPVTLTYAWQRNGASISGATAATYKLTGADAGTTITVSVTGTKSGYASVSKTSAATATVAKGTLTTATPTVSGTAKVGSTLTAKAGTWGPAPVVLAYQWYRTGVAISGATATTYKLTSSDAAKAITVKVTGSESGYTTVSKTSAPVTPTT